MEASLVVDVVLVLATAAASAVGAVVGFGSALLVAPLMLIFYPAPVVAATLATLGVFTATLGYAADLRDPRRPELYGRGLLWMLAGAAAASVPGLWLASVVPQRAAQVILGLLSLLAVGVLLRGRPAEGRLPDCAAGLAGAASQVAASVTGVGGPPLMVHLLASGWDVRRGRMTYGVFFILANAAIVAGLLLTGQASPIVQIVVSGAAATLLSLKARVQVADERIRKALIVVTALAGVVVLAKGLF